MCSLLSTIPEGFEVSLGCGTGGWFAGVLVRPDRDKPYVEDLGEKVSSVGARLRAGQTDGAWQDALCGPVGLQIVLVREGQNQPEVLQTGDRLWGPAAGDTATGEALLCWCEKRSEAWALVVWQDGEARTLVSSSHLLCAPAVAEVDGVVHAACQEMGAAGPEVFVCAEDGTRLYTKPGRAPRLLAVGACLCLVHEEPAVDRCPLRLVEFEGGKHTRDLALPAGDDLNLKPDLAATPAGDLYVAHEACPAWGHDHFLGRHRDLYLWHLAAGADVFCAAPGRLSIPYRASHGLNEPPVQPRLLLVDGQPAVAFRRFEYYTARPLSWHVYLTRCDGCTWTPPARLSSVHGLPETAYAVRENGGQLLAAFTNCEQRPPLTLEDYYAGREAQGMPGRVHNTFVTIESLPLDTDHGPVPSLPNRVGEEYGISLGVRAPAPPPPHHAPPSAPGELVWGDLHQHTLWSKCISPVDGTREENLRYQRDVLGCRVFSFGEHTTMMSDSEFTYCLDQMEAEAGADGVVIYGTEPWSEGHDTNLYAIDREVFQRLRLIYQRHRSLEAILREIKREFPKREVACLRHFHGGGAGRWNVAAPAVVETRVPEIEPAMEAMQIRGNVFLGETDAHPGLPAFPVNFLNAGARIGLVGGTDHSNDPGPNHFCLTGFWVEAFTAEAVWDALWERKTVALSNGKIGIWAQAGDVPIGEGLSASGEVRICAWLSSARDLTRATLVRDGEVLGWQAVAGTTAEIELVDPAPAPGAHWYCVTAEAESSPDLRRPVMGHASPFFVAVE